MPLFRASQAVVEHGEEAARQLFPEEQRAIETASAFLSDERCDTGFLFSGFAMTALPHRAPRDPNASWRRENGKFELVIDPGTILNPKTDKTVRTGIPYGSRARLILFFLQSEALRTQSAEITLGANMSAWMEKMGIPHGGSGYAGIKEQSQRISGCNLTFIWRGDGVSGTTKTSIVDSTLFFSRDGKQGSLFDDKCRLSSRFYNELLSHPVPVLESSIRALSNSSLSMDVYVLLAYRLHVLEKPITISWQALRNQFGPEYSELRNFKMRFIENLKESVAVYPEANVDVTADGVVLKPSRPAVPIREINRILHRAA